MFKAYYFSLLRRRVTKSAKVQKPLPFVLGFIARVPEMNYRESVWKRETAESHERKDGKRKEGRKEIRARESHLYHNDWGRNEKKAKNKTTISDTFVIRFICCIKANPHFADASSTVIFACYKNSLTFPPFYCSAVLCCNQGKPSNKAHISWRCICFSQGY